jgi:hypothetical protein
VALPGDIGEPGARIDVRALAAASGRIPAFSEVAGCRKIRRLAAKPRRESLDAQPEISTEIAFFSALRPFSTKRTNFGHLE